jgi:hypothetical protein
MSFASDPLTVRLSTTPTWSPCEPYHHWTVPARCTGHCSDRHPSPQVSATCVATLSPVQHPGKGNFHFCRTTPLPRCFPHFSFRRLLRRTAPDVIITTAPSIIAAALECHPHLPSMLHRKPSHRAEQILWSVGLGLCHRALKCRSHL